MMISTKSWQAQMKSSSIQHLPITPEAQIIYKNSQSSLTEQVKIMQLSINRLESEKDSLSCKVLDLKQLLQRISIEQQREAARNQRITQNLNQKINRLEKSLEISRENGSHLHQIKSFWEEFIE
mmetsp:Transcript_10090/g.10038  ORF Transcript_10090/g.10038 Transcript_10090/m.10038 type:complete len:124 (+) Transcript_10090:76-447(+)